MFIDLNLLYSNTVEEISLSDTYNIPKKYITNEDVSSLENIQVEGKITKKEQEIYIKINLNGTMILKDAISLEEVEYPFSLEYDDFLEENYKNNENRLDIFQFLWDNIVLEVPLGFTKETNFSKYQGDGWKLISEEDLNKE